jgi:hypothetical protein
MAKAILEFDLNESDDVTAHKRCVQSLDMAICLHEISQHLRAITKYAPDSMSQETYDELIKVKEKFWEILSDNNISIDELLK